MAQVTWTPQALDDLRSVYEFIARDSPGAAQLFALRILESTDRLAGFPLSGRKVPEFDREDIREVIVQNYRVVYRIRGADVEVATVHHGARRMRDLEA